MRKLFLLLLFLPLSLLADSGLELAKKIDSINNGFIGEESKMEMTLVDASGTKIVRKLKAKFMEVKGDGDKSIMIFEAPKDVRGTKMLTWTHKTKDDDQWLYLPALRRVKRISSRNKTSSFMGSEFSYEDLSSQEVEKYSYKKLKDTMLEKQSVWVLEKYPLKKSGYSKQVHYISKKYNQVLKVDYYDKKKTLLKTSLSSDFKKFNVKGKTFYRPSKIHMKNLQTRKESFLESSSRKLGVKFSSKLFNKRNLR